MCNDFEQNIAWVAYRAAMREADLAISERQGEIDLPRAAEIHIGDMAAVARLADDALEQPAPQRDFQFPVRGPPFRQQPPLPRPGILLFRIHGERLPEDEIPVHPQRLAGHWHRRHLAGRAG
jgi:hypothetical protein